MLLDEVVNDERRDPEWEATKVVRQRGRGEQRKKRSWFEKPSTGHVEKKRDAA